MSWIFFAIAAPALYSVSNFFDRFLIEKKIKDPVALTIFWGIYSIFFGLILWTIRGFPILPLVDMLLIFAAGGCTQIALFPYYRAIQQDETSNVIPLFQFIPIFVFVLAFVFLGELLTPGQFMGFVMIVIGGFLIALRHDEGRAFALRASFWYMILSSFIYAISVVIFKFVAVRYVFWDVFAYEVVGAFFGVVPFLVVRSMRRRFFELCSTLTASILGIILLNDAFWIAGRILGFYALVIGPASLVSALGGFQPLFALCYGVVLSLWFPKIITEDISRRALLAKFFAIILILSGTWYISI